MLLLLLLMVSFNFLMFLPLFPFIFPSCLLLFLSLCCLIFLLRFHLVLFLLLRSLPRSFPFPLSFSCHPSYYSGRLSSFFTSSYVFLLYFLSFPCLLSLLLFRLPVFPLPSCRLFCIVSSGRLFVFFLVYLFCCSTFPFGLVSSPFSGSAFGFSGFFYFLLLLRLLSSLLSLLPFRLLLLLLRRVLPLW